MLDMKTPLHMRYLLTTLFVLLAFAGCSCKSDNPHSAILLRAEADALEAKIVLTELRDGRLTNALELLEMQIDSSIIIVDHSLSKMSDPERNLALGTLRSLKAYREAHPRQREAVIQDADKEDADEMIQGTEKASRVLSDLK